METLVLQMEPLVLYLFCRLLSLDQICERKMQFDISSEMYTKDAKTTL